MAKTKQPTIDEIIQQACARLTAETKRLPGSEGLVWKMTLELLRSCSPDSLFEIFEPVEHTTEGKAKSLISSLALLAAPSSVSTERGPRLALGSSKALRRLKAIAEEHPALSNEVLSALKENVTEPLIKNRRVFQSYEAEYANRLRALLGSQIEEGNEYSLVIFLQLMPCYENFIEGGKKAIGSGAYQLAEKWRVLIPDAQVLIASLRDRPKPGGPLDAHLRHLECKLAALER
ncbi:MAG: hypothetical protein AB7G80_06085 [Dongiaceae bacterium]